MNEESESYGDPLSRDGQDEVITVRRRAYHALIKDLEFLVTLYEERERKMEQVRPRNTANEIRHILARHEQEIR